MFKIRNIKKINVVIKQKEKFPTKRPALKNTINTCIK